jgi:hypothetical protein
LFRLLLFTWSASLGPPGLTGLHMVRLSAPRCSNVSTKLDDD